MVKGIKIRVGYQPDPPRLSLEAESLSFSFFSWNPEQGFHERYLGQAPTRCLTTSPALSSREMERVRDVFYRGHQPPVPCWVADLATQFTRTTVRRELEKAPPYRYTTGDTAPVVWGLYVPTRGRLEIVALWKTALPSWEEWGRAILGYSLPRIAEGDKAQAILEVAEGMK